MWPSDDGLLFHTQFPVGTRQSVVRAIRSEELMKRGSQPTSLQLGRLIWVGPLTVLASIAAVLLVRFTAVALLHPEPTFMPLTMVPAIIDTAVLVTFAVFVYHRVVSGRDLPRMLMGVAGWRFFTLDILSRPTDSWQLGPCSFPLSRTLRSRSGLERSGPTLSHLLQCTSRHGRCVCRC